MLQLTPSLSLLHKPFLSPQTLNPFRLLQTCKTLQEAEQHHALFLKTGTFSHPSVASCFLSLYADPKINSLDYARSVFDQIEQPTLVSWNVLIKCYVGNQRSHDAVVLFYELVHELVPDNFTVPCVIKGCARLNAIEEGKQIHGLVLKIGLGLDKFVQSSLVSLYSKCGEIGLARKVFDEMRDRDLVTWNSLVDGYARCGEVEVAMELFDQMQERDLFSWTVLVDGLSKCGKVEMAREVFDRMPNRNSVSWNAMINGYMKAGDFETARQLFSGMPARDVITWNSMIAGYEFNGRFMEALELFHEILKEDVMPSHATLVSALSAVSGLAILGKGRWIHSFMVKHGFELDGVLGTSLIDMYSKCGSIENALTVFRAIHRKKLGHWTSIIVGLGMHGMADQVLELFLEMRKNGMQPHAITFIGVLNACSHAGLVDLGRFYFNLMTNDYGIEPTIEHYGCFVDILCRAGCLDEAKNVIESMPMKPNKVIWMSLLSGARNHGNVELGDYAARHLIEVSPDTIGCYVVLSNMYAAADQWEKVSQVREMMRTRGVKKDPGCSSIEHRGVLHEFVVGDKSHPRTEEIYSKLSEMREKLKSVGHVPDTSQVLLCLEEEKEKEAELENHSERLAIAFGLINSEAGSPIRIIKNLRVCSDCHSVTKHLSSIYNREIIVRDNSRFHHFRNGSCSCKDFW
ncbi:pentatricopeptide repeat-containing protein At2g29760, chloroplastic-like [Pyrus x bretschneideri]|uniref:pentatricopeptide repeat-containing protein At2g29760, chloroplastic-like n=1 Tax=Pyrus x bretschneideri TaxID=225117 RepID=UPI00202F25C0|nr:pentatricopeptide repeat-containing protein At2g29760, chloroplastic-like [Pyrus x bretschneideri]